MRTTRWLLTAAASLLAVGAASAQTAPPATTMPPAPPPAMSAPAASGFTPLTPAPGAGIVDVLTASGQFTTLLKAVDATGLTPVLKSAGPLTVFAPTDAAFAALPAGALDNLMKPDNLPQLQALLTYHVINARIPAIKGHGQTSIQSVAAGKKVTVDGSGETVKVNDATAVQSDIKASNGAIYVIDKVLSPDFVPPPPPAVEPEAPPPAAAATTSTTTKKTTTRKKR